MMIRVATSEDIPAIVLLGKSVHHKSERAHLAFNEAGARELVSKCISSPMLCAFVADVDGEVMGLVLGCVQKWPYLDGRFATDLVLIATYPGAGRKLLEQLVEWAREQGVDEVICSVSYGKKSARATEGLYVRQGFEFRGGMFAMTLRK